MPVGRTNRRAFIAGLSGRCGSAAGGKGAAAGEAIPDRGVGSEPQKSRGSYARERLSRPSAGAWLR